jgi:uncharacterized membrane protein YqjE
MHSNFEFNFANDLMNLRFGIRKGHYGFVLLASLFGAGVSLAQILCNKDESVQQFFTLANINLETISFIVFAVSTLFAALLLVIFDSPPSAYELKKLTAVNSIFYAFILLISGLNVVATMPSLPIYSDLMQVKLDEAPATVEKIPVKEQQAMTPSTFYAPQQQKSAIKQQRMPSKY